jgi:hypothetical protein
LGSRTIARPSATRWRCPPESCRVEDPGGALNPPFDLALVEFPHLQAECHVVVHAHVRIERVVLEHHRDVAIHRRQIVDDFIANQNVSRGDGFEPGYHTQRGGLAAAGRADKDHELLVADLQVHVLHGVHLAVFLVRVADNDLGHD